MGTRSEYSFVGSCPSLPDWFVDWVANVADDMETSEDAAFVELEAALTGEPDFSAYMRYRLKDVGIHPADDWAISFLKGKTPTGLPFYVIQDAGIEHVYVKGDLDLDAEATAAAEQGFWHFA